MHHMNSSWGGGIPHLSKPKDNSFPSKFAIFQVSQVPRKGDRSSAIRQICLNSREGSNLVSSAKAFYFRQPTNSQNICGNSLNEANRLEQSLDLEISTESFFLLYAGEGVQVHSSSTPKGSLEKIAEGHFSISTQKKYQVFDKKNYQLLLKLILSTTQTNENKVLKYSTRHKNQTSDIEGFFSKNEEVLNASANIGDSSISFDRPLSFKSKNVLTFLLSIFLANSKLGSVNGLEKSLSVSPFHKSGSISSKKHLHVLQKFAIGTTSVLRGRSLSVGNPVFSKNKFSQQTNGKKEFFPVLILFYLVFLGFTGAQQKFLLHQERISFSSLAPKVLITNGDKEKLKNTTKTNVNLGQSKNFGSKDSYRKLRFSEYSPIKTAVARVTGVHGFSDSTAEAVGKRSLPTNPKTEAFDGVSPLTLKQNIWSLAPEGNFNLRVERILRYSVHISTQFFVFFLIQRLISENNFGRHNPLRQKDAKTNQARILWPKKSGWFRVKTKSVLENTLPGIQDISTLVEVLIQSLNIGGRGFVSLPKMGEGFHRFLDSTGPPQLWTNPKTHTFGPPPTAEKSSFIAPPKGYLFVGPPGTGKTLLAQEIAQLAEVPFICVSASEIQKQIEIGTRIGALRLRKLFQQAQSLSPCILFFDEIDAIAQRQSQHDSKLFTEFLIQMDSWGKKAVETPDIKKKFNTKNHSVILGTTNYLDRLDSAFVRSGRFDRILALNYPSKKVRFDILKYYLKKQNSVEDLSFKTFSTKQNASPNESKELVVNTRSKVSLGTNLGLNYLSFVTEGFSQAHLAKLVNESLLFTLSKNEMLLRKNVWEKQSTNKVLTKHSFTSLLHGLKQMLIHRKNLPYQQIEGLN